jgi:hypothetical protein
MCCHTDPDAAQKSAPYGSHDKPGWAGADAVRVPVQGATLHQFMLPGSFPKFAELPSEHRNASLLLYERYRGLDESVEWSQRY